MSSLLLVLVSAALLLLAYHTYGRFLQRHLFTDHMKRLTPSHVFEDKMDYVKTPSKILAGHHFMSIAGISPILGPAIAVIWGFVPALLWVILSTIFIGATHDLGALALSLHHQGRSIGDLTDMILGKRARVLFLLLILVLLWMVLIVSTLLIIYLLEAYPEIVFPLLLEIPVALALGYFIYQRGVSIVISTLSALFVLYGAIYLGTYLPITMPSLVISPAITWALFLLLFSSLSSILPVWSLLQPRNHINAWQVCIGMVLSMVGILLFRPHIVAPAFHLTPSGAPPLLPILLVTIAGGAITGYHSLVCSGTTVRELDSQREGRPIVYGGMLLEGFLAILVILACTAGFTSIGDWTLYYGTWDMGGSLGFMIHPFIEGLSSFIVSLGIPTSFATTLVALIVVSFAMTTLDSATRIQRYIITEILSSYELEPLKKPYVSTLFAILPVFFFLLFVGMDGFKEQTLLWPFLGTVDQLLAGFVLLLITLHLYRLQRRISFTLWPMLFILSMVGWSLLLHINLFILQGHIVLAMIGGLFFILEIWLILEAISTLRKINREEIYYLNL